MQLGNPVSAAYLQRCDLAAFDQLIAGLFADAQRLAHGANVHDIRVFLQHHAVHFFGGVIEFIDHDLQIDFPVEMKRIQAEMREVLAQEKASQKMLEDAFRGIGYGIK